MAAKIMWQKASQVASLPPTYEATLEFPFASGITNGTVVRIRGVDVGSVINVRPCLERIDAKVQVRDATSYIPRNAIVEVNQSGLVGETIIDITPISPVPRPSIGPLDPGCPSEGLIVCNKERIKGQQGVSMEDLMRLCGKMSKNTKESDVRDFIKTAEHLGDVVVSSKLLLEKVENFTEKVEPVVKDLQERRLLNSLTELLKQTSRILQNLRDVKYRLKTVSLPLGPVQRAATTGLGGGAPMLVPPAFLIFSCALTADVFGEAPVYLLSGCTTTTVATRVAQAGPIGSGSLINWHKSSGFVVGVDDVCTWGEHQGFTSVAPGQTCRYLGFHVGVEVSPRQQFEPVLASIRRKLCHWASMHLSLAGRALIVNRVLLATAWFTLSRLRRLVRNFLWGGSDGTRDTRPRVSWNSTKSCPNKIPN
ncbi:hypothetical protein L7F22_023822 [Adiantum nelumboides]|nr:hypothetical protein [Adiantum nelumboides]